MTVRTAIILSVLALTSSSHSLRVEESFKAGRGIRTGFIKDIVLWNGQVVFGTSDGLYFYNPKSKLWKRITERNGIAGNYVSSLVAYGDTLFAGTTRGLSVLKNGKWKTFRKKKGGLPDNRITSLAFDGRFLWVGTEIWGATTYDTKTGKWRKKPYTALDGLADNKVNDIAVDGNLIWIATENGISAFDKSMGIFNTYDSESGLPSDRVLSIAVDSQFVWCATPDGLVKFDKYEEKGEFVEGLKGEVVLAVQIDGEYIWVGTFDGIYLVNRQTEKVESLNLPNLPGKVFASFAVDGNYIWTATDEPKGGVAKIKKDFPQVEISPETAYIKKGIVKISGSVFDYTGIKKILIKHKPTLIQGNWSSSGIKIKSPKGILNGEIAVWNTKGLKDDIYELQITAENSLGKKNTVHYSIVVDNIPPIVKLKAVPDVVADRTLIVSGSFIENNIKDILIRVNGGKWVSADIDFSQRKFSSEVILSKGKNRIDVKAVDVCLNEKSTFLNVIYDAIPPQISFETPNNQKVKDESFLLKGIAKEENLSEILVKETGQKADYRLLKDGRFEFWVKLKLKPGKNIFTIVASDKAFRKSEKKFVITYSYSGPEIVLNPYPEKTDKSKVSISGKVKGGKVESVMVLPINKTVPVDKKGRFKFDLTLSPGENVFKLMVWDKLGNSFSKVISITFTPKEIAEIQEVVETGESGYMSDWQKKYLELKKKYEELEKQIEMLKKQTGRQTLPYVPTPSPVPSRVPRYSLPRVSALVFVPYRPSAGEDLWTVAKRYYNNRLYFTRIAYFNDESVGKTAKIRKSILLPTPILLGKLSRLKGQTRKTVMKIADACGNALALGKRNLIGLEEELKKKGVSVKRIGNCLLVNGKVGVGVGIYPRCGRIRVSVYFGRDRVMINF